MKKIFTFCLLMLLLVMSSCTNTNHTHSFGNEWQKDETYHWLVCECLEISNKNEHKWDEGILTITPTPEKDGEKTFTCEDCSFVKTEIVKYEERTTVTKEEWENVFVEHENCTIQYFFYYQNDKTIENILKITKEKAYINVPEESAVDEGVVIAGSEMYEFGKMVFFLLIRGKEDSLYDVIVNKMDMFTYKDGAYSAKGTDLGAVYYISPDNSDDINDITIKFEDGKLKEVRFTSFVQDDKYYEEVVVSNIGNTIVE